jgi:glycosyltransferase involved in cell wall biosynthesis
MPVYNAGQHLRAAVMSIINQSYTHWELIIIDDGSTDHAIESLNDIVDIRIKIIQDGINKGLAARLNEIIDMANGDFIARMDQDDLSYPDRFLLQLKLFLDHPNLDLVAGKAIAISENNKLLGYLPFFLNTHAVKSKPWLGLYMPHPTWMGRVTWFRKHRYASPAHYLCEDQELLLRSSESSHFSVTDKVVLAYRIRDSVSSKKLLKVRWSLLKMQSSFFYQKRSYGYLLLSVISFALRLVTDLCHTKFRFNKISDHDSESFYRVLNLIEKK